MRRRDKRDKDSEKEMGLVREKIDADAYQDGGGPAAAVDIFFKEDFAGDGVGDQGKRGGGWGYEAQVEVVQSE